MCIRDRAVDAAIEEAKPKIKDEKLRWMFENCFPNTLDTTVRYRVKNGRPDTCLLYTSFGLAALVHPVNYLP